MVCRAENRSLREASCCSVEVVKGAAGLRVYGLESTEVTAMFTPGAASAAERACAAASSSGVAFDFSLPFSSKSRPDAIRSPFTRASRASKPSDVESCSSSGDRVAVRSQYPAAVNARRSRSRSTTSRVAADCTRPADRPGPILRHSTGETS